MFKLFKKKEEKPKFYIMNCVSACPRDEKKCPLWTTMYRTDKDADGKEKTVAEGRCAVAWIPTLLVEMNQSIQKISKGNDNGKT